MSTKIEINCQPYNTLPEQVDENQKNIKTIAEVVNLVLEEGVDVFLDLTHYTEDGTLTEEEFTKVSNAQTRIIYTTGTEKSVYTSRGEDIGAIYYQTSIILNAVCHEYTFVIYKDTKDFEVYDEVVSLGLTEDEVNALIDSKITDAINDNY